MLKALLPSELQSLEQKASWGTSVWQWGNWIFFKPFIWEGQPASSSQMPESCRCFLSLGRIYSPTSGEIWSCPWRAIENIPPHVSQHSPVKVTVRWISVSSGQSMLNLDSLRIMKTVCFWGEVRRCWSKALISLLLPCLVSAILGGKFCRT